MRLKLRTTGMECRSCEQRIEEALSKLDGISSVSSDFSEEMTEVEYDEGIISRQRIEEEVRALGFGTGDSRKPLSERFGSLAIALGVFTILASAYLLFRDSINVDFTNISMETGIAALFILGFLTGFHCIGMCGGFVLSYSRNLKGAGDLMPHLLYGSGKTVSYTIIGALFGALFFATLQTILALTDISFLHRQFITGALFLIATGFCYGYNGLVSKLYRKESQPGSKET